jgi:hypothetical protein
MNLIIKIVSRHFHKSILLSTVFWPDLKNYLPIDNDFPCAPDLPVAAFSGNRLKQGQGM